MPFDTGHGEIPMQWLAVGPPAATVSVPQGVPELPCLSSEDVEYPERLAAFLVALRWWAERDRLQVAAPH